MFERRLKIFLLILLCVTGVLVLRAMQLQVLGREHWQKRALEAGKRRELVETTRGSIIDAKGEIIAVDEACNDACIDYRVLIDPPDPQWVESEAARRLTRILGREYTAASRERRKQLREPEIERVQQDIQNMWPALARESGHKLSEIEDARRAIVQKVQMRQRVLWYWRYRAALEEKAGQGPSPWYHKWLIGDAADAPEVDSFVQTVREQLEAHPILHDIDNDTVIRLKKNLERYPGLAVEDGTRRRYPYGNAACHVIGNLSRVMKEDVENDPNLVNPLRRYELNDLIGRSGLEALCEPALRGSRGYVERHSGASEELERVEAVPGGAVRTTLDIKLQRDVEAMFNRVTIRNDDGTVEHNVAMHGSAVLIDVASGGVIAMASAPTFDPNRFNELYAELQRDELNKPLMNRATQWALEPGSTVKPIIGLGAIADSRLLVHQGIECTGYLVHRGKKIDKGFRCWTASKFEGTQYDALVAHHQIPSPGHRGHHGNPDGFLTLADALERSCNVYFESVAGMMGVGGVRKWYDRFGLGRPTGLGIPEWSGRIPDPQGLPYAEVQRATWFAGIGQGQMSATTVQMANVAATIARDGVWVRPRLIAADVPTTRPAGVTPVDGPDRVDLGIPPAAIAAAKSGMLNVMYGDGGTANTDIALPPVRMAGKTGTAETKTKLRTKQRDKRGEEVKVKEPVFDGKGKLIGEKLVTAYDYYEPVSTQNRTGAPSWYRGFGPDGKKLKHAWFIGFAPVERPKVAIAVMVEYGGSGGSSALSVASGALGACIKHGYLDASANIATAAAETR